MSGLPTLMREIQACDVCPLPHGIRPVLQVDPAARILIAAQAPGRRVHESGVPFSDPSGERLRQWMDVSTEEFYDAQRVAILPMGFCYPGHGPSGDLPPRPECAPTWRERVLQQLPNVLLTLVVGRYAQSYHLPQGLESVTEAVRDWKRHWPNVLPLPHPSPRNGAWLYRNPWFEQDVLPPLRQRVRALLA